MAGPVGWNMRPSQSLCGHWTVQTNTNMNTPHSLWICNSIIVAEVVWPPGSADHLSFNWYYHHWLT